MVKIYVEESSKVITSITLKGHANYDTFGKDIVCASISSIVTTSINGILKLDKDAIFYQEDDGFITIKNIKKDKITNELLDNLVNLLENLKENYPKNILMERGNLWN